MKRTHVEPFIHTRPPEASGQASGSGGANDRVEVEFLRDEGGRAEAFLDRLTRLVRRLEGRPRAMVVEALRRQERRVRDARRLAGVSKTLLDRCTFRPPPGAERAEEVRDTLFRARGAAWPPTPGDLRAPYRAAAEQLGVTEEEVDRLLFADRLEARRLNRAPRLDGRRLLAAYNLDLARGVLLDAERVVLTARGGWRSIFRAIKLARLMYRVERGKGRREYRVELTGPAAPFLARPQRYGARFARVVPALARAPGWRLEADLVREGRAATFALDGRAPVEGSRGRGRPRHDSFFERSLARDFAEKLGTERGGWTLEREATPVALGEELFLPDFTVRHEDGREALVEIVGFWTPEYLESKVRKVRSAGMENLVLVVYDALDQGASARGEEPASRRLAQAQERDDPPETPAGQAAQDAASGLSTDRVLRFKKKPRIGEVMEAVERVAVRRDESDAGGGTNASG
ncbi:MAG: DUF790 family protein [Gemmatimonadota bacterium]